MTASSATSAVASAGAAWERMIVFLLAPRRSYGQAAGGVARRSRMRKCALLASRTNAVRPMRMTRRRWPTGPRGRQRRRRPGRGSGRRRRGGTPRPQLSGKRRGKRRRTKRCTITDHAAEYRAATGRIGASAHHRGHPKSCHMKNHSLLCPTTAPPATQLARCALRPSHHTSPSASAPSTGLPTLPAGKRGRHEG